MIPRVDHSASQPASQSASLHHLVLFISSQHTLASVRPGNSQRATPWAGIPCPQRRDQNKKESPVVPVLITSNLSRVSLLYLSGKSQCKQQHFLGQRKTCMPNGRRPLKVIAKSCRDVVLNYLLFYMHDWYILVCLLPTARADVCHVCTCFSAPLGLAQHHHASEPFQAGYPSASLLSQRHTWAGNQGKSRSRLGRVR